MPHTGGTDADRGSGVSLASLITRSWAAAVCLVACCIAINVASFELQRATFGPRVDHLSDARTALAESLVARRAERRDLGLASSARSGTYAASAGAEAAVASSDEKYVTLLAAGDGAIARTVAETVSSAGAWSTSASGAAGRGGRPGFAGRSAAPGSSQPAAPSFARYRELETRLAGQLSAAIDAVRARRGTVTAAAAAIEAALVLLFGAGALWQLRRMRRAVVQPVNQLLGAIDDIARGVAPRQIGVTALAELVQLQVGLGHMAESREAAASQLRTTEEQLHRIMETASEAYICTDANGSVLRWNGEAVQLLGWTAEEALGEPIRRLILSGSLRDDFERCVRMSAEGRPRRRIDAVVKHRDGSDVEVEATLWTTEHRGKTLFNAFLHDVSRRRQAERDLRLAYERQREAADRLREVDKIRNEFVYTVSHELRTPLTSIIGYIDMLSDGSAGPLSDDQAQLVAVAERNSRRLLRLIEDLLALSRIEEGNLRIDMRPCSLNQVVESAREAIAPSLDARHIEVRLELDPLDTNADLDARQIERVLVNLLSNAVKFTADGGSISLRTAPGAAGMELTVADTGIGIPLEEQRDLFQPFFRSSTARASAVQGTGLGLSIVKSIVNAHRGTVALESTPGVGTTVKVCLPYSERGSATDSEPEERLQEEVA